MTGWRRIGGRCIVHVVQRCVPAYPRLRRTLYSMFIVIFVLFVRLGRPILSGQILCRSLTGHCWPSSKCHQNMHRHPTQFCPQACVSGHAHARARAAVGPAQRGQRYGAGGVGGTAGRGSHHAQRRRGACSGALRAAAPGCVHHSCWRAVACLRGHNAQAHSFLLLS